MPITAIVSVFATYHLVLQLRFFEPFAVYINLIYYAVKDSFTFVIILFLVMSAFGNSMFILSMIERPDNEDDKISGSSFIASLMSVAKGKAFSIELEYPTIWAIFVGLYGYGVGIMLSYILISILEHI